MIKKYEKPTIYKIKSLNNEKTKIWKNFMRNILYNRETIW